MPRNSEATSPARNSSPSKRYLLRTTLRDGKLSGEISRHRQGSPTAREPGAATAATVAWGNTGGQSSSIQPTTLVREDINSSPENRYRPPRTPRDGLHRSVATLGTHWDSHSRRLIYTNRTTPESSSPKYPPEPVSQRSASHTPTSITSRSPSNLPTGSLPQERANGGKRRSTRTMVVNGATKPASRDPLNGNIKMDSSSAKTDHPSMSPWLGPAFSTDEKVGSTSQLEWKSRCLDVLSNIPESINKEAASLILNEIVVQGDAVRWNDIAGLEVAKNALRETVVYPLLRPDLFLGLRQPATGLLLFGPPGTGKTMLARAAATESNATFFSISASSLTSKYLGESEKLVRALFYLAKAFSPSIIFVDEIDSLLGQRSGSGEHEATGRIKTEFLIQWNDLQRAVVGKDQDAKAPKPGTEGNVLVLAATNLPWAIDEAARRRFVRRQYIPLPESATRETQLRTLLSQQKHSLTDFEIRQLVHMTGGFSGSDITSLAKDAAMGPLRSLGDAVLNMSMEEIQPINFAHFTTSIRTIRPSVSKEGLNKYEEWARDFGERGG